MGKRRDGGRWTPLDKEATKLVTTKRNHLATQPHRAAATSTHSATTNVRGYTISGCLYFRLLPQAWPVA